MAMPAVSRVFLLLLLVVSVTHMWVWPGLVKGMQHTHKG